MRLLLLPLLASVATAAPEIINDVALRAKFQNTLGKLAEAGEHPTAQSFADSIDELPATSTLPADAKLATSAPEHPADSVHLISSVYKCGRCDHWHLAGVATAWALTHDGLMVTNQHVLAKARGQVMGVCDRHGNVHPILEVIAADEASDVALFRVEATDLVPLQLGPPAGIGAEVEVISHPHGRFFMHTFGRVSRYSETPQREDRPSVVRMSITADYAKGSSGGPVLDSENRVVGMVCNTQSIYYESNNGQPKGPLQMVVKNCVPADAIRTLLGGG
ncbi:serine protease [Haloferula sp. A504]|uniref:serine protease n=1 Tax=Haloferula sp. A504 TaxID=3373601 RepID=UPI0031C379B2|nr:serine protease [Verrucomicrobiaceae bacterium E54]